MCFNRFLSLCDRGYCQAVECRLLVRAREEALNCEHDSVELALRILVDEEPKQYSSTSHLAPVHHTLQRMSNVSL
jgi:hypothetical protein